MHSQLHNFLLDEWQKDEVQKKALSKGGEEEGRHCVCYDKVNYAMKQHNLILQRMFYVCPLLTRTLCTVRWDGWYHARITMFRMKLEPAVSMNQSKAFEYKSAWKYTVCQTVSVPLFVLSLSLSQIKGGNISRGTTAADVADRTKEGTAQWQLSTALHICSESHGRHFPDCSSSVHWLE